MTFFVLDENPVRSANTMCWLDCESASVDGARIIVSAIKHHGGNTDDLPFEPIDAHPLVKWAVLSADNTRWLYRFTRASSIKWKGTGYEVLAEQLNAIAAAIDERIPTGQLTLFGNYFIDGDVMDIATIESNLAYYEQTRKHLRWGDDDPTILYGGNQNESNN